MESRPQGGMGASHANIQKKSLPGRERSEYKGPEVHLRIREEASVEAASE